MTSSNARKEHATLTLTLTAERDIAMTQHPVAPDTYLRSRLTGDIALVVSVTHDGHAMILLPGETNPIDCQPSRIGPTGSTNPEHLWHVVPTPRI